MSHHGLGEQSGSHCTFAPSHGGDAYIQKFNLFYKISKYLSDIRLFYKISKYSYQMCKLYDKQV